MASASTRTSEIIGGRDHGNIVVEDDPHPSASVTVEEPELSSNALNSKRPRPRLLLIKPLSDVSNTGAGVESRSTSRFG